MKIVLGIVGGMGAEAGCYFHQRLIQKTRVKKDQDHLEVILHTNSKVPDRTKAILEGGEDPVPQINRSLNLLAAGGANMIVMACITAHYFIDRLQVPPHTQLINLLDISADRLRKNYPNLRKVGILATSGSIKSGLFQTWFGRYQLETVVLPMARIRSLIMEPIYGEKGIKQGYHQGMPREKLMQAVEQLIKLGAEAIVAGCTEIPLVLSQQDMELPFVDLMEAGIDWILERAGAKSTHASEF
jgi:aspartate racemase